MTEATEAKFFDLSSMRVDVEKERNGVWITLKGGTRVLLARLGNPSYQEYNKSQLAGREWNEISDATSRRMLAAAVGNCVLLDWENFYIDGKLVEYEPDRAVEILAAPEYHDFYELIVKMSNTMEHYRARKLVNDADIVGEG